MSYKGNFSRWSSSGKKILDNPLFSVHLLVCKENLFVVLSNSIYTSAPFRMYSCWNFRLFREIAPGQNDIVIKTVSSLPPFYCHSLYSPVPGSMLSLTFLSVFPLSFECGLVTQINEMWVQALWLFNKLVTRAPSGVNVSSQRLYKKVGLLRRDQSGRY